jgi:hypothetical protein
LGRHDPKACQRATDLAWAEEKIHRAISARPDMPLVPRGHDLKRHEAREGRAVPARSGPSPCSTYYINVPRDRGANYLFPINALITQISQRMGCSITNSTLEITFNMKKVGMD